MKSTRRTLLMLALAGLTGTFTAEVWASYGRCRSGNCKNSAGQTAGKRSRHAHGRQPQGAGRGPGMQSAGRRHRSANTGMLKDRNWIHILLANRGQIQRKVKNVENGVQTLTETNNPQLRMTLVQHVKSMSKRIDTKQPIHRRDPLFDALFRHADKITMEIQPTKKGVRVIETSDDPHVAKLIQSHARVVSLFLKNGHLEVRKNHPVPK